MAYDYRYPNQVKPPAPPVPPAAPTDPKAVASAAGAVGGLVQRAFGSIGNSQPAQPSLPPMSFQGNIAMPTSQNGANVSTGRQPNGYKPTAAPFGMDMSAPGVNEQFWNNNQNMWLESPSLDWVDQQLPQFQSPWAGEQAINASLGNQGSNYGGEYWQGVQGAGNTPAEQAIQGGYKGPNNAQSAFNQTQSALPGSLQPQFDKYYDRLHDKAVSDVNAQGAARGSYGSNASLNNSIGAGLDVEAQRAKAATEFSLDDSANQRAWMDSLGTMGRNADLSGVDMFNANKGAAQYGLDKTKTLGDLAFKADDSELARDKFGLDRAETADRMRQNRLDSGISTAFGSEAAHRGQLDAAFGASNTAQNNREDRVNTLYNQLSGMGSDVQDFVMENYDALLGGDKQMSDDELQTMISRAADERGWDQQQQERIMRDMKALGDFINGKKEADESLPAAGVTG